MCSKMRTINAEQTHDRHVQQVCNPLPVNDLENDIRWSVFGMAPALVRCAEKAHKWFRELVPVSFRGIGG